MYWENEHSTTSEELTKCHKSRRQWKRKTEAKEIQYQELLEEKIVKSHSSVETLAILIRKSYQSSRGAYSVGSVKIEPNYLNRINILL